MKFQQEFRNPRLVKNLATVIKTEANKLNRPLRLMEVCGTHTMAIASFGLKSLLPDNIQLVSGPGCPVCVTPVDYINHAVALAAQPDTIITTFGDLLRVPGSQTSLLLERARGADVRTVHSSLEAMQLARNTPDKQVIFLGVGFETTTPTIAAAILQARLMGLKNFMVLTSHKTMPEAMQALSATEGIQLDGYICPAHVSTVIGSNAYLPLVEQFRIPCVVTGFEPADILQGILMLIQQALAGVAKVENQYSRAVTASGNPKAIALLEQLFRPADVIWRGLGMIRSSGLVLRDEFASFDAARQMPLELSPATEPAGCRCGQVLTGQLAPAQCPLFGKTCRPESPAGACMVSSEGSCAAAWRYAC